ncbi:glycoside hydrolase family 15 [Dyadobacter luteus]|uniref:Glycoside hydrolase family 15 n=1 Tax=Dyadobacter luteus TaxID=2259619 RepID=A0A3D8Y6C0_9BACT|nr:glycoside hydrolase family 15 [Dyadobacter luteus]REA58216.1 glycoside hydrolase family 15 [Dyadobacter luteus]
MKSLFDKWKTRIPKYSEVHRELFASLSQKFGAEGEKKINLGKHFSTNYELYTYAFFLGLYRNEFAPLSEGEKKIDFSHHIQHWGSKTNVSTRKDFTNLQENMFMALFAKTDLDLVALEKGELDEDNAVRSLLGTMESYTNGGLILIKEKLEENPNYFLKATSFLDLILGSNSSKQN